jgi:hypothetical protein
MKTENERRELWTFKETGNYLRRSSKSIKRYLDNGLIEGFKVTKNGRPLVYADTVTEKNLNALKPKFLNKSKK